MDIDGTFSDFWELVDLFYSAMGNFRRLHDAYDRKVLKYSAERGVDRKNLKLSAEEVSGLFDFKALERLRDQSLYFLKENAHKLFRSSDSTDTFDRYVSEIFHEISILKEEHYTVKVYGPLDNNGMSSMMLEEVHTYFPIRLGKVKALFEKARVRLEALFPQHARNPILVRSLYMFGDGLLAGVYAGGLEELYRFLYPAGGAAEGYLRVGESFLQSGFWKLAKESLEKARNAALRDGLGQDRLRPIDELLKQVRIKSA
jgi:hypothetical protein